MMFLLNYLIWTFFIVGGLYIFMVLVFRLYNKGFFVACDSKARLDGKVVVITGASAGIGKEAARDFAKRGAKVIMACRNREKAQRVADSIIETSGNKSVFVRMLDTSLMSSVREFAKEFIRLEDRLDVLVLNAGVGGFAEKRVTSEGIELTMATNHFGHFLLVNLLSDILLKSKPSRVVVTSSQSHLLVSKLNSKDLIFAKEKYGQLKAYSLSKLCNVLMTRLLAVYFLGKGVTANCFCPGMVDTEIFYKSSGIIFTLSRLIVHIVGRTEEEGAQTLIHLAVSEDVADVSGAYFVDCKERKSNSLAEDAGLIKKVWEMSEDVVKLTPSERGLRNRILK